MRRFIAGLVVTIGIAGCNPDAAGPGSALSPIPAPRLTTAAATVTPLVTSGSDQACALKTDGTAVCWGRDTYAAGLSSVPAELPSLIDLAAGGVRNCGITTGKALTCWPAGGDYALFDDRIPLVTDAKKVELGHADGCVIHDDQSLTCWGFFLRAPTDLGTVSDVALGGNHACAVKTDQTVACWTGYAPTAEPVPEAAATGALQVAAGYDYACVLKTTGAVVCWGTGESGTQNVPSGLPTATQLSGGGGFACIVNTTQTVNCWSGQNTLTKYVPEDLDEVSQISTGSNNACALRIDGGVRCWGYEGYGAPAPAGLNLFATPPTPAEQIADLKTLVTGFALPSGTSTALNAKLNAALAAINSGNTAQACISLQDVINQTNALSGKKITVASATAIIAATTTIRTAAGC